MGQDAISLFQLNQRIKGVIEDSFLSTIWVKAEIGELKVNRNGHCYIDLIEKDEGSDQLVARSRAIIWGYTFRMLKAFFESTTGQELSAGLKVLVKVSVEFQELFGLSLIIKDIDPAYTMGDMARRRLEVIKQLEEEGVLSMNKELEMPLVPQKIAIISSASAAGYGDFIDQLDNNPYGAKFYHHLFPAIMQGQQAEASIVSALERVFEYAWFFDVVVLIRGGGASIDLLCFDSYWVAYNLAQFPLPVITGIGHERDETVADMVAHLRLKTPTAVAAWLIDAAAGFLGLLEDRSDRMKDLSSGILRREGLKADRLTTAFAPRVNKHMFRNRQQLERQVARLPMLSMQRVSHSKHDLRHFNDLLLDKTRLLVRDKNRGLALFYEQLKSASGHMFDNQLNRLKFLQQSVRMNDPERLLERGYSLTYSNGRLIKDAEGLKPGDELITRLKRGEVTSLVKKRPGPKNAGGGYN